MFGGPAIIPGEVGGAFHTFFQTTTGATPTGSLFFRDYAANGTPSPFKFLTSHPIDSIGSSVLDGPNAVRLGDGNFVVLTDGIEKIFASFVSESGGFINRQTFRQRRRRRMRCRRLRRHGRRLAALWHEINANPTPDTCELAAEIFRVDFIP